MKIEGEAMLENILFAWEKYRGKIENICLDIFIFMVCSGIIHTLYSDQKILATFGGFVAVFGCTPLVKIVQDKAKKI